MYYITSIDTLIQGDYSRKKSVETVYTKTTMIRLDEF